MVVKTHIENAKKKLGDATSKLGHTTKKKPLLVIGIACGGLVGIGSIFMLLGGGFFGFRLWQKEWVRQGDTDLQFVEVALPFTNQADLVNSLPFMAAAALDLDGDGRDELFLGGGKVQQDAIFSFRDGAFIDTTAEYKLSKDTPDATMGAASLDLDNDGTPELIVARESGVWLYQFTNGVASGVKLPFDIADNTTPLSIALGDVNRDGWADMYVSGYIKIDRVEGESIFSNGYGGFSYLFMNNGDNTWRDLSEEAGVFRQHNTFTAVFADLDNDLDSDLVIAQDTGKVEMYENTGSFPMKPIENPSVFSYPMGVAVGDYDNDGLLDLYFSNVGYTLPPALLRGNLPKDAPFNPEYMLFKNNGALNFADTSRNTNTAKYGFGWGVVFADMNLDGFEDILAAQNYARFPANDLLERYPGKLLQFFPEAEKFRPVELNAGVANRAFGITPVISDFNLDGAPDIVWANLDGPAKAYISENADSRNWIAVDLPNEARSLNAIVRVNTGDDRELTKQLMTSQGLGSDQSRRLIFGLGEAASVDKVSITFQDGDVVSFDAPEIRQTLDVTR